MAMVESIVGLVLMLLLLLLIFIFLCKPWRFFSFYSRRLIKVDDLERPLFPGDSPSPSPRNDLSRSCDLEGSSAQIDGSFSSPSTHGLVYKQRIPSADAHVSQGAALILDVISEPPEHLLVGQTLKRTLVPSWPVEGRKHIRKDEGYCNSVSFDDDKYQVSLPQDTTDQRSSLTLEVISGPSRGLRCSLQSTNASRFPLTLGRVPPSDLLLKDSEVSGKHAMINWNLNVQITHHAEHNIPFGVGLASDAMSLRRGGKKLPMEDVCYYQWPLPEVDQFGLFGIFDGHGGAAAARSASKTLPKTVADMLSVSERRERVISLGDASEVLRDAFFQTEAAMNHQYEGCTATVLLVWADQQDDFFAQCANVGDSACVINIGEKPIAMTEDHRITSQSERNRLRKSGPPLKDGETRLCGLNIARMLGDKFLKEQDARFSSEPYVSQAVHIPKGSQAFALMASDGLWDVIGIKKAVQLVLQTKERYAADKENSNSAERIANFVLSEARTLRTKDNTSIIFLDFDANRTAACNLDS
ncbi:protein phosphatase 2C 70 isoform X2 [Magnolia sinica]|uniref:protein phosphatase 2C 70 isoform X2 n=1 Tax=Magnolia sinica TaxID=86752 RepID=UPI00265A0E03|nr:protein phosphatase 2C 70 isoform X2 [Magnolia sinica]